MIVEHLAYEWIFWLALAVVTLAMIATHLFVPESPVKSPARIDWGGAVLLSAALTSLLVAVSQGNTWGWGSARIVGLFALALAVLAGWIAYEHRVHDPMVDMHMLRARSVWATNLTAALVGFGMFSSFILIPQFVQAPAGSGFGFGASVTEAGLFMLPSAGMMLWPGLSAAGWAGGSGRACRC